MIDVFLSIGTPATRAQKDFHAAVQAELRRMGLNPRTPGQSETSNRQPLKAVERCMRDCAGVIVVAYERIFIEAGTEKRNSDDVESLEGVRFPTVWNHIEGGQASALGLPLLVLAEEGLLETAMLENRYDWTVQWIPIDQNVLRRADIADVLQDWKKQIEKHAATAAAAAPVERIGEQDPEKESIGKLLGRLRAGQLYTVGAALVVILGGAFKLGGVLTSQTVKTTAVVSQSGTAEASCYRVRVDSPKPGASVKSPYVVKGVSDALPEGHRVWVFTVTPPNQPEEYWPASASEVVSGEWSVTVNPRTSTAGSTKRFAAFVVGPDGSTLINYYRQAMRAQFSDTGEWNAIKKTADMTKCSSTQTVVLR